MFFLERQMIKHYRNYEQSVWSVCTLSDSKFAVGLLNGNIELWNKDYSVHSDILNGHSNKVWSIIKVKNDIIASSSDDMTVRLWNHEKLECIKVLYGHNQPIRKISLISETRLASGSYDHTIKIWDLESFCCEFNILGNDCSIFALCSLNEKTFRSGNENGLIKFYYTSNYECYQTISHHGKYAVNNIIKLSSGNFISSCGEDTYFKLINFLDGSLKKTFKGHSCAVMNLIQLNEYYIISISWDKSLKSWNLENALCERTIETESHVWALDLIRI